MTTEPLERRYGRKVAATAVAVTTLLRELISLYKPNLPKRLRSDVLRILLGVGEVGARGRVPQIQTADKTGT